MLNLYVLKKQFDPYLKLWLEQREKDGIESEWLFPDPDDMSQPLSPETMDGWKNGFTTFLGKDFYWHSLRHFFTTSLSENNIPSAVIQDIVGWSSSDMVQLYTDTDADEQIGKYFGEDGIKQVENKGLSDL